LAVRNRSDGSREEERRKRTKKKNEEEEDDEEVGTEARSTGAEISAASAEGAVDDGSARCVLRPKEWCEPPRHGLERPRPTLDCFTDITKSTALPAPKSVSSRRPVVLTILHTYSLHSQAGKAERTLSRES
jgi:hypothetical protein